MIKPSSFLPHSKFGATISRRDFGTMAAIAGATSTLTACAEETDVDTAPTAESNLAMTHLIDTIYQVCFVVTDLQAAIKTWTEQLKVGPFLVFENFTFTDDDGAPLPVDISLALAYSGDNFIELIQLNAGRPSIYDFVADAGGGFHHIAKLTSDLEASIAEAEAAGFPLAFKGNFAPDGRLAYVDASSAYGGYMEYVEYNETVAGLLRYMRAGANSWDGATPTMPFPE